MPAYRALSPLGFPLVKEENTISDLFRNGSRVLDLVLEVFPAWHKYRCPDCGTPIFEYKGQVVRESPGSAPKTVPIRIPCRNRECARIVEIEGFAERHFEEGENKLYSLKSDV